MRRTVTCVNNEKKDYLEDIRSSILYLYSRYDDLIYENLSRLFYISFSVFLFSLL